MKAKNLLAILLTFIISFGVLSLAYAEESSDVPEGYTPIYTAEDLNNIRNNLSGKYILMNDIDLSSYENWEPIGTYNTPFTGELDGNGCLIINLKIKAVCSEKYNFFGLFGVTADSTLKNIIVSNSNISVYENENVDMINSYVAVGTIAAKTIGENYSKILRCSSTGKIDVFGFSSVFVGGLVGVGVKDNCILSSSNYADINVTTKKEKQKIYVGGLLGSASENEEEYSESFYPIKQSANWGNILINNKICSKETQFFIGGISGLQTNGNEISDCYNRGEISSIDSVGKFKVGGILGRAISRLEKSYNSGKINIQTDENDVVCSICFIKEPEGPSLGAEPVMPQDFVVYNCYYLASPLYPCFQNSDDNYVLFNKIYSLSESEFVHQDSFDSLDFENIWTMEENGYPILKNQPEIPEKIPEESSTESTTEPSTEYTTESTSESTAESTAEPSSEPISEPQEDKCWLADLWIVNVLKQTINFVAGIINNIFSIIGIKTV